MPRIRAVVLAIVSVLALAGCGGNDPAVQTSPTTDDVVPTTPGADPSTEPTGAASDTPVPIESAAVVLEPDGLGFFDQTGSSSRVEFGQAASEVVAALSSVLGASTSVESGMECGPGPLDAVTWSNLSVYMSEQTLAGWYLDPGPVAPTTAQGIGIGSTRAEMDAAFGQVDVEMSTIGLEWAGGGLFGTISSDGPEGEVIVMWSGATCIAR